MNTSFLCYIRPAFSIHRFISTPSPALSVRKNNVPPETPREDDVTNFERDRQSVLKIVQRFKKDPSTFPVEDQPFAVIDPRFLGRVMHMVELRPERGFSNFLPVGTMLIRHMSRRFWAKRAINNYQSDDILNEEEIRAGTKRAFELISQNVCKDTIKDLVTRGVCLESTVRRFEGAGKHMSPRQRNLLNLTEKDIYAIAPGVLGPYQVLRPAMYHGVPHLVYSLLGCAFYKKELLFNAVKNVPLLEKVTEEDRLSMPVGYGYDAPRAVFGYITFGNQFEKAAKLDPEVKLLDFQFLIL